ncbi:MAG: alanine racemase [Paenibacillaceae bacterium ZCTH02-B3]|nr:MAG: alanine racemase [Paenibacillaceae bacterium ZCTH02-B3]
MSREVGLLLSDFYRPTWVEISLDAIRHNIAQFRGMLPEGIRLMAVVKANAYGHGAVEVAREAERAGIDYLGVAFLDEALQLREAGISAPVFVLGYTPPDGLDAAAERDIAIGLYDERVLEAIAAGAGRRKKPVKVHVKIDTGMGRLGLADPDEAVRFIDKALRTPGVKVEGLYTHYAKADEADKTYTEMQYRKFAGIVDHFRRRGVTFDYLHAGNSATGIDTPEWTCNMLRIGISLYGLYPSDEVKRERVALRPAMAYKTKIIHLKELPPGSGISYGAIYRTAGTERIATLPVGYADGYSRLLTGKAEVLIRGKRAPVVGRICMDQCMVNVTHIPDATVGDEAVLFGRQGDGEITADELAGWLGTINYEITCMVNHRVPRVYVRDDGTVERIVNGLADGR